MCVCEQALALIGLKPTEAQCQAIRARLGADPAGTVALAGRAACREPVVLPGHGSSTSLAPVSADFQNLIQELFKPQLDDLAGSRFSSEDLSRLLESPTKLLVSPNHSRCPSGFWVWTRTSSSDEQDSLV